MRALCVSPPGARLWPDRSHRHHRPPASDKTRGAETPRSATGSLESLRTQLSLLTGRRQRAAVPCQRGARPAPTALPPSQSGQSSKAAQRTREYKKPAAAKQTPGPALPRGQRSRGATGPGEQTLPSRATGSALPLRHRPTHIASTPAPCREKTALALLLSSLASIA